VKTGLKVGISNMQSSRGKCVPNQFEIRTDKGILFQSYNSIIVFKRSDGKIFLDAQHWDYSTTTGKYRNIFLGETKRETEEKIKSGEYKLVDLN